MAVDPATWRASVQDVANVIPQRTGDPAGAAQGTFTATTVPTGAQVEGIIRGVQAEVLTAVGEVTEELATPVAAGGGPGETMAGHVVAVGAAAYVEMSFYPDLPEGATSLWDRYQALLAALVGAAAPGTQPGLPGAEAGAERPMNADWSFPASVQTGVGTSTWERF
jgi:hypothetical protein